ncbi:MAG: Glycosyltransferase [Verrucomicrobia bacterium]|jgi:cellulose synthase/poly-beta-1,6-N-acetylglucosamine synthase-like glycosyltransferase|nr:MAG: Glycosyltransferase [Verrucomicrobiota bacterium]
MTSLPWYQIAWVAAHAIVLVGLGLYGLHRYSILIRFLLHRNREPKPNGTLATTPFITVQLPIFNERFVVDRLLEAVAALDYPRHLLEIQVLDDSTDDTTRRAERKVQELRARGLDAKLIHRVDRSGYKAGALENGLATAKGELVYILDADFVPPPDVLWRMVPFFADPGVGMVQTRWGHLNRSESALTRVQSILLDGHFLMEQTARSRSGRFFHFNGTAGIWRKVCIQEAGGWEPDTLTEDLDLSLRAQMKGWRFVYLNDVVTPAELPADMDGFKAQQHRWTKGSVQNAIKWLVPVWRAKLSLPVKIEATFQLTCNFVYLLLVALLVLMMPIPGVAPEVQWGAIPSLALFIVGTMSAVIFYSVTALTLYPRDWFRDLLHLPLLLALGIGMSLNNARGVVEAISGKRSSFVRTPKAGGPGGRQKNYSAAKSATMWGELLLAVIYSWITFDAAWDGEWLSVPFLALFAIGFYFVAWPSVLRRLSRPERVPTASPPSSHDLPQKSEFPVHAVELGAGSDELR